MKRVVTFGELLLSLGSKGNHRLVQAEEFTARYTGAEANVAVSLAHFGVEALVVSKVPAHEIGQACVNALRRFPTACDAKSRGTQQPYGNREHENCHYRLRFRRCLGGTGALRRRGP